MTISDRKLKALLLSIVISVIGYLVLSTYAGFGDIIAIFKKVGIWGSSIILILSLLNYIARFYRWELYLKKLSHTVPLWDNLIIYLSGFALTTTPGKAGETIRGLFLKKYSVPFATNISCFFSERLSDLIAILFFVLLGVQYFHNSLLTIFGASLLIILFLLVIKNPDYLNYFLKKFNNKPKLYKSLIHIKSILFQSKLLHQPQFFLSILLLTIISWGFEAYGFYYLIHIIGFDIPLFHACFIYSFAMLIGGLSFLPGGLGSAELTMVLLLQQAGVNFAEASAITIICRIATLWFAVIIGVICLIPKIIKHKTE